MDNGRKANKEPRRENLIISTVAIYGLTVQLYKGETLLVREKAMLDSGSSFNLMFYTLYKGLKQRHKLVLDPTDVQLVSVTDHNLACKGAVTLTLKIGGITGDLEFIVVHDSVKFISNLLGSRFLEIFSILFSFPTRKAYMVNGNITNTITLRILKGETPVIPRDVANSVGLLDHNLRNMVLEEATVPITVVNEVESEVKKVSKCMRSVSRSSSFPSSSPFFHTISPFSSVKEILPHQDHLGKNLNFPRFLNKEERSPLANAGAIRSISEKT